MVAWLVAAAAGVFRVVVVVLTYLLTYLLTCCWLLASVLDVAVRAGMEGQRTVACGYWLLRGVTVLRPGCMSGRGGIRRAHASAVCEGVGGWVVRFIVGQPTAGGVGAGRCCCVS